MIVTVGFALGAATLEAATANPDVHFIGVDQFQAGEDVVAGAGLANYESLIFNEAQAGYLVGIVAASISESNVIAAIGGSGTIPPVVNYMRGYENGAKSVKPDINRSPKYISDDLAWPSTTRRGAVTATGRSEGRTDVIFSRRQDRQRRAAVGPGGRHLRIGSTSTSGSRPPIRRLHRHERREAPDQGSA